MNFGAENRLGSIDSVVQARGGLLGVEPMCIDGWFREWMKLCTTSLKSLIF